MSDNGEAAQKKLKGYIVVPTMHARLEREVLSYPVEEQSERMRDFVRQTRLEAEEAARQQVDALLHAPTD